MPLPSADQQTSPPRADWQRWAEPAALGGILLLALGLRLWGLERLGWGAEYYSAAVRSMALNAHNFFYASFDPAGFISVDKPPLALWLQVLSVKLLGFKPLSLLLPQALEGVAAVWVLHRLTRLAWGVMPALLAALLLALTPVWVAVNRTNNTDTCLTLVLLLAAWALVAAVQGGGRRHWLGAMALVGLAFNVKMLAAFIVLPTFVVIYALGAPGGWRRRLLDLALGGLVLILVALPWVLAVELTPPQQRPYVGSSRHNSMLELIVGHNAAGRFVSRAKTAPPPGEAPPAPAQPDQALVSSGDATTRQALAQMSRRMFVTAPSGPLRLASGQLAAQVGWLWPLALVPPLLWTARRRRPEAPGRDLGLSLWLGWGATYLAVYSSLGGIIHYYYLSTLAPALAALAGKGLADLWGLYRRGGRPALALPAALALTAAWQLCLQASALSRPLEFPWGASPPWLAWLGWLHGGLILACLAAVALLALPLPLPLAGGAGRPSRRGGAALALGLAALLALPLTWSMSAVLRPGHGLMPSADLARLLLSPPQVQAFARLRAAQAAGLERLIAFLRANQGQAHYLLSTSTTQVAAPIIIRTGLPVLARGGFHGLDAALSPQTLAALVGGGQVRLALLGDVAAVSRRMGAEQAGQALSDWISTHGRPVDPALWRRGGREGRWRLYDLRPQAGLAPSASRSQRPWVKAIFSNMITRPVARM